MLELFFVDVDWDICVGEMLESTRMIEVKVANDDSFYVLDIVSRGFDSIREPMVVGIFDSGKDIRDWGGPFLFLCLIIRIGMDGTRI
jgi:hypothetical protein